MTGFFQKLFGQHKPEKNEVLTVPVTPIPLSDQTEKPVSRSAPPQLVAACAQSVGEQRDHNEDALFTLTTTIASDKTHLPFGLYIVADGMGGHQHGEIASGIAVRSLASYIVRELYTPLISPQAAPPDESIQEILVAGIQEAHRAILEEAPGGGTTLTAVLILSEQMTIAHVGDSRAYLVSSDGSIQALTRDHSLVKRLVELGQITVEEAAIHPQRNVLYRALGQGEPIEPEVITSPINSTSYLMLCSDGLWGVVAEEQLAHFILSSPTLQQACQSMVTAANTAGGPDNITVILVRLLD